MYELKRHVVHLSLLLVAVSAGCNDKSYSLVPVPVSQSTPFSYQGRIGRIWGGDNFEVVENDKLHYAFIRGIDSPEPGQAFCEEAKRELRLLTEKKQVVINVVDRDEYKREECSVEVTDLATGEVVDPALKLLERGLAWFDQSDGPWAEQYRDAEKVARESKVGLWAEADPVPPWEFWERQVEKLAAPRN